MAAAPQTGTATFVGSSGTSYSKDIYISDVAAAPATYDSGAGASAGSLQFWKAPENVTLVDFSIVTGLTDTTFGRLTANGSPLQSVIRWANHLNTLATRPVLNTGFAKGTQVGMIQG